MRSSNKMNSILNIRMHSILLIKMYSVLEVEATCLSLYSCQSCTLSTIIAPIFCDLNDCTKDTKITKNSTLN